MRYQILFYEKKAFPIFLTVYVLRVVSIRRDITSHIVRDAGLGVTITEAPFRADLAAKWAGASRIQTATACRGRYINKGLIIGWIHSDVRDFVLFRLRLCHFFLFLYHVLKSRHNIMYLHMSNVTDQSRQKCHNKGKKHKHREDAHRFWVCHLAVGEVFTVLCEALRCLANVLPFLLNINGGSSEFHIGSRIKIIHLFLLFDASEHLGLTPQFRRTHLEFSMNFGFIPKDCIL